MAMSSLLSFSLCFLLFSHCCLASRQGQQQFGSGHDCQIRNLDALEPNNRIKSEAGQTEVWDENNEQLQCAGVAVVRYTIEPRGLLLPSFTNAPSIAYVVQGRGIQGTLIPGCPETYQSFQEFERGQGREQEQRERYQGQGREQQREREQREREQGQGREQQQEREQREREQEQERGQAQGGRFQDQHQKIQHYREGDVLALPAGVAKWCYNDGDRPLVIVALLDTSNDANQLDQNPRRFYLAGNPEEEHQQKGRQQGRHGQQGRRGQQESAGNNIFSGFEVRLLAEAFGVSTETARKLQNPKDDRGNIIRVEGGLQVIRPPRSLEEREREQEREQERQREREGQGRGGRGNGLEETLCSMRFRENIGDPSRADVYTPQAGRISSLNSQNLPIIRLLQLSAERGVLYRNAIKAPHYNLNAHSVVYVTKGQAQVQIVDDNGESVFNGELSEGQLLVEPQNFAVIKQAGNEGFEWIAFKTNDNAMRAPLAGRTSVMRALPVEVIRHAYQISQEEARRLKFNREETAVFAPSSRSERRAYA